MPKLANSIVAEFPGGRTGLKESNTIKKRYFKAFQHFTQEGLGINDDSNHRNIAYRGIDKDGRIKFILIDVLWISEKTNFQQSNKEKQF